MDDSHPFLSAFPPVDNGRTLYVQGMEPALKEALKGRGYFVVELLSLPRQTANDNVEYLRAKLQAIEEGTIDGSAEQRKLLELEMKSYGMLDTRSIKMTLKGALASDDIKSLLGWAPSRHTLRDNSTAIAAEPQKAIKGKDT